MFWRNTLPSSSLQPWILRQYVPLKRWYPCTSPQTVTTDKITMGIFKTCGLIISLSCRTSLPCWYLLHEGPRSRLYWCLCDISTSDPCNPTTGRYFSFPHWSGRDWELPRAVTGTDTSSRLSDAGAHYSSCLFQLAEWHAGSYLSAYTTQCKKSGTGN